MFVEVGSNHMGKKEYIDMFCDEVSRNHILKFQLFPNTPQFTGSGNIHLPRDLFEHALLKRDVFASVFTEDDLNYILGIKEVKFVKISFSKRHQSDWIEKIKQSGKKLVISTDPFDATHYPDDIELYCANVNGQVLYPCPFQLDLVGLFSMGYHGISDHTLGINQTAMILFNFPYTEKHVKLAKMDTDCPDARFSITTDNLKFLDKLMEEKRYENFTRGV